MGANNSIPADYTAPAYGILSLDIFLSTVAIAGRILSRRVMKAAPAIDDYLAYIAYVANTGLLISGLMLTAFGALDLDQVSVETEDNKQRVKSTFNSLAVLYVFAITFIKLSILFLYRRTFTMLTTWFRYAWWAILVLVLLWTATCIILIALQEASILPKGGFSRLGISITGIVNAFSDVLILGLPAFMISRMRLQRKQKIALISIFLIGGIASIVSLVRGTIFFINRAYRLNDAYSDYLDIILTATESSAGLMCACLPLMKPLIVQVTRRIQTWRGMDTAHQGWTTGASTSIGREKGKATRGITRVDDYEIQLLQINSERGSMPEEGHVVIVEGDWDQRGPCEIASPVEPNRLWDQRRLEEMQWETQKTWGHNRI